jgi:DNA-directed RNA polymerase subunit RPC12/RpoP
MNVICSQCNATYRFPENRIPDRRAAFQCKRCGKRILIEPPTAVDASQVRKAESQKRPSEMVKASASHNLAITSEFPEVTAFASQKYDLDQLLLPDKKGRYKNRLNKLKLKLLGAVQGTLDKLLDHDEQVLRIAAAIAYYPAELFLGNGWMTILYNRYIIV